MLTVAKNPKDAPTGGALLHFPFLPGARAEGLGLIVDLVKPKCVVFGASTNATIPLGNNDQFDFTGLIIKLVGTDIAVLVLPDLNSARSSQTRRASLNLDRPYELHQRLLDLGARILNTDSSQWAELVEPSILAGLNHGLAGISLADFVSQQINNPELESSAKLPKIPESEP